MFTVPGDAVAGAAAAGHRPNRGTLLAAGASLCLYEAGMALNDWADREEDARERPHRPLPSGRIRPGAALTAAGALTGAGLALAGAAGRRTLATAALLAGTVWAYDLRLKHTAAGPTAMAAARSLDLLLGATATAHRAGASTSASRHADGGASRPPTAVVPEPGRMRPDPGTLRPGAASPVAGRPRARSTGAAARPASGARTLRTPRHVPGAPGLRGAASAHPVTEVSRQAARGGPGAVRGTALPAAALPAAALLGAHTLAVTGVSRQETRGGSSAAPLGALAAVAAVATAAAGRTPGLRTAWAPTGTPRRGGPTGVPAPPPRTVRSAGAPPRTAGTTGARVRTALAAAYAASAARPLLHAALNPSQQLLQRAVGGGIRAMIPLQAALAARAGAPRTAVSLLALTPLARRLSRKVSPT
ncbi:UbiA family prenyltransferase [Streptomyces sp. JJ36]|uniref:UbiA family prenyltransferase n=1 Tax=Streptomyces sp. JJ36 TaxID=2736645 RepID=UPI001F02E9AA|nr:UbiA family prenyltransferase [Streptomyces sp. JJ36]